MVIQIDSVSFSLNNDYLSIIEDDLKVLTNKKFIYINYF